eukprot:jgi/Chlat1/7056/Chrsp56S06672
MGLPVDTLALVRQLESEGLSTAHAEAITNALLSVCSASIERLTTGFATEAEMLSYELKHDASISQFKSDFKREQEIHTTSVNRDTDRLRNDIDKLKVEMKYEIDKLTASQKLDLNLEKGRIRDEMRSLDDSLKKLDGKLDREINGVKTIIEANKYEIIKYCIGTLVSTTAVGLAILRIIL